MSRTTLYAGLCERAAQYQAAGDPVVSVDTNQEELIGDFRNAGLEWQAKGTPEVVRA